MVDDWVNKKAKQLTDWIYDEQQKRGEATKDITQALLEAYEKGKEDSRGVGMQSILGWCK